VALQCGEATEINSVEVAIRRGSFQKNQDVHSFQYQSKLPVEIFSFKKLSIE